MSKDTPNNEEALRITDDNEKPNPLGITIDVKKYEYYLENSNLTEEQKKEFLNTLWAIISELVSYGIGVHPLQQLEFPCGKHHESVANTALLTPDMLGFKDQKLSENLEDVTKLETESQGEGVEA